MKCPKCGSENVQFEAKKNTPKVFWACVLALGGIGMMVFGIFGFLIGGILGAIVGLILHVALPTTYESIMICKNCGHCCKAKP